jgi:hypothetical protein
MDNLILFFDCYIISRRWDCNATYKKPSFPRLAEMIGLRNASSTYKHQHKIDVVKYVLASYQQVPWSHVVIRFECEDEDDSNCFASYAKELFPSAIVLNQRSDTAEKWVRHLSPLTSFGNPWVYFSPNNDHPLIGDPRDLVEAVRLAQDLEPIYPDHVVSIVYSHWTESQSAAAPNEHDWGAHVQNFPTVLGETPAGRIVRHSRFMCDSIQIFRLDILLKIFSATPTKGRLIRLEETGFYLSPKVKQITVCPTREVCRHYDSYMHVISTTPPLFIPDGFFDKKIRVRFGFNDHKDGWVNLNPVQQYSYLGGVADMRCMVSELPLFWKDRIAEVVYAQELPRLAQRNLFEAQRQIRNPYDERFFGDFYVHSAHRLMRSRGLQPPVDHVSLFRKVMVSGETLVLEATRGNGAIVVFVEFGIVRIMEQAYLQGVPIPLTGDSPHTLNTDQRTVLVVVRFD